MDADKLNEACDTAFLENYFPSATESPDPRWAMFADGFKQGASWLMQQPLADRLTDEEKEKIKTIYKREVDSMELETRRIKDSQSQIEQICHESNFWQAKLKADMLEQIFGKDLFNQPTEV